jgi:Ca2+-binding RTX toxin-like protein
VTYSYNTAERFLEVRSDGADRIDLRPENIEATDPPLEPLMLNGVPVMADGFPIRSQHLSKLHIIGGPGDNFIDVQIPYESLFRGLQTGDTTIDGGGGNDTIDAHNGAILNGGPGDDFINADFADVVDGGPGTDVVRAHRSFLVNGIELTESKIIFDFDFPFPTRSASLLSIEKAIIDVSTHRSAFVIDATEFSGSVTMLSGEGNDTLLGGPGGNLIDGGDGNDSILAGEGNDTVNGGSGNDTIDGEKGDDSVNGGDGDDSLLGGGQNDTLSGGAGSDRLIGESGDDLLEGGAGDDFLDGGPGDDLLDGGGGNNRLTGDTGNDTYRFSGTSDDGVERTDTITELVGGGIDTLQFVNITVPVLGGYGVYATLHSAQLAIINNRTIMADTLGVPRLENAIGSSLADWLEGNLDDNLLHGEDGDDIIQGGEGNDTLLGGDGNDVLLGGDQDDFLNGIFGSDTVFGDRGNDTLFGGPGADLLLGGEGLDVGDSKSDLATTIQSEPKTIKVGDSVVYKHVFTNLGADVAVDPRVIGVATGPVSAASLDEVIGRPILHPLTGVNTGHRRLDPGETVVRPVSGVGIAPGGLGRYETTISLGEDEVSIDPVPTNNPAEAITVVLPRVEPPRITSEEGERGRPPQTNSSGDSHQLMALKTVSGNGNWTATVTNAEVFPNLSNSRQTTQIAIGDPILGSVSFSGTEVGNGDSTAPVLSFDGTKVAFLSTATNLVEGFIDNNAFRADIFFRDLTTGVTRLVSRSATRPGTAEFQPSAPLISDDGQFVFFTSGSRDQIVGDNNDFSDVFAYDTVNDTMELVSVAADGTQANSNSFLLGISYDGRFVLFSSNANNLAPGDVSSTARHKLFLKDRQTGTVTLISADQFGNVGGTSPFSSSDGKAVVTPDGRFVAFTSSSTSLVSGVSDTSDTNDLFVRDVANSTVQLVSVSSDGTAARGVTDSGAGFKIVLSDDGRFVAFESSGNDLAASFPNANYKIYVRDLQTGTTRPVTLNATGTAVGTRPSSTIQALFTLQSMSADGRFVAFLSNAIDHVTGITDTNLVPDLFIRDLVNNTTSLASRNTLGTSTANTNTVSAILSRDGQKVFFTSDATNLVRHFTDGGTVTTDLFSNSDHVSLVYIAPNGNGSNDLTLRRNGDFLEIFDNRTNTVVARRRADDTEAVLIQGSDDENDTLRIDFSGGSLAVPSGIQFDGGLDTAGTNQDRVFLINRTFDTVQYDLTGNNEGYVTLDDAIFVYDHVEPIVDQTTAETRIVNNVLDGDQRMTLQDDGTPNNGLSRITFTGPNSPPALTFANPTNSLEFNSFAGNDTFTETGRDAGLIAAVQDDVTPVVFNLAPSFTVGPNQTVAINSAARTVLNWAKNISPGADSEAAQTLTFLVIADNTSLFATQPAVSPTGTLTFTPAEDAVGMATIFVRLQDDGGTDNGGVDVSGFQSFTITVTDSPLSPNFTAGPNQTVDEDTGLHEIDNWATDLFAGPNLESPTFSFVVTNDNNGLFTTQPTISADGTLRFALAANAFGQTTVTAKLLVNDGVAESAEQTFTITVNDLPEPVFNPVTIALAAANANTHLRVNAVTNHVELINAVTNAVLLDLTADGVTQLTINGGREDNRLTVDFTNGNPLPADGLFFNGGQQRKHDDLVLTGGAFDSVTHAFANKHDGTVTIDGATIMYTGLEPILDNLAVVDRVFEFAATNDAITLADAARAVNGRLKLSSARSSETVEFAAPTGSLTIRGGAGNDRVTVRNLDHLFVTSNATLVIEGGDGHDSLDASRVSKAVTLRGGAGRDTLRGGSGNDVLEGGDDRDWLFGNRGDDTLLGGGDQDKLFGGSDEDFLDDDLLPRGSRRGTLFAKLVDAVLGEYSPHSQD